MEKINANILGYNSKEHLKKCIDSLLSQDYPNLEITFIDNASSDGSEKYVRENYPTLKIIQTGFNSFYAGGHNIGIKNTDGEFVSFLNPDVVLSSNFYSELVKPIIADPKIAGAQGKLLRPEMEGEEKIIDSAGILLNKSRRPFDRGQNEEDRGQYDTSFLLLAINGAAPLYRRSALVDSAINGEILDEDLAMYWDDIDLGWRLNLFGYKLYYEPKAIGFHERAAGASKNGYKKPIELMKHRKTISTFAQRMSFKNNILTFIKNDSGPIFWKYLPSIIFRQLIIFVYILFFDPKILSIIPTLFKQIPRAYKKRKIILKRKIASDLTMEQFFVSRNLSK